VTSITKPDRESNFVLSFPSSCTIAVVVERAPDDPGCWLVWARNHSWLHSDFGAALADARQIAGGFGVVVISSAAVVPC